MSGVAAEVGSTANNYQILARLATGGMAEIFLARGTSGTGVERYVVLKRILRDRANDVQLVKMFLDEARLASQLQHANVAQVYDIGKLGDSYFFTMEYVHGETVRALLHRARSLRRDIPNNVILTVVAGSAAGLHHAHDRLGHDGKPLGIVHRDVSPSNLMVSYDGGVKVVDFGVAKAENRVQETRSGTVKGKIAYLSPEQCRGAPVDRRSDLFSLGIVFWEMLTVERLYKRASDFDNMTAIVTEEPPPPSVRRPGISPELDRVVLKLLSKDPNRRYQTGDELIEALEEVGPKLGAMISTSSVGRFLRDLFGQRPEPWLEMDATTVQMHQPEGPGVTVTSEPVPRELVSPPAQSIDHMLMKVRDLTVRDSEERPPDPLARSQMLTAQAMPAQHADLAETQRVGYAPSPPGSMVVQQRASGPMQPLGDTHRGTGASPPIDIRSPQTLQDVRSGPIGAGMPGENFSPTGSSSGEHAFSSSGSSGVHERFPGAGSTSGAHAYPSGSQLGYPVLSQAHGQTPQPSRRWPLIAIVAIAAVLGSVTVWFVMRGSNDSPTVPDAPVVAVADAADRVQIAVEPDSGVRAAEPDAPVVATTPDAAQATPDAAVVAVDAAVPKIDPLLVSFEEKRYSDVVAACSRTFGAEHASACTLSACRTSQDTKAQRWYTKITSASTKRTIAANCREAGVDVTPKVVRPPPTKPDAGVDPCAANPMACQR